jgi:signal transduction histidine kinase
VLVVEQDPGRAAAVEFALQPGAVLKTFGSAEEAATHEADLFVVVSRSTADAASACELLKGRSATFVPLMVVLPASPPDARLGALELGVDECLLEPFDPELLRRRALALARLRGLWSDCEIEMARLRRVAALKDDLVALILHDLRNPLTGVFGFLSALGVAAQDPRHRALREDVEGALASARKLQEVLGELLEIRALEENALPLRRQPIRLAELAHSALASLEGAALEKNIHFDVDAPAGEPAALDPRLVRRALENLIANAVRYSPPGSRIHISARRQADRAYIAVSDRGPGVPESLKAAIFDKFTTVEGSVGEPRRGFGLGLYQVRLVVEAHGGSASALDREGGGTVFALSLPAE